MSKKIETEIIIKTRPIINDPPGLTIRSALHQLGFTGVESVRTGVVYTLVTEEGANLDEITKVTINRASNPVLHDAVTRTRLIED